MENWREDFVMGKPVEIEIDGRIFKYKPATGEDESKWGDICYIEYTDNEGETKRKLSGDLLNMCKIGNITHIPYPIEAIKEILHKDVNWVNLSKEEKYHFIGQLKPGLLNRLLEEIRKIDNGMDEKKKPNS